MSFTTQAVVGLNGTLTVSGAFPFATGETVELVVRPKAVAKTTPAKAVKKAALIKVRAKQEKTTALSIMYCRNAS